MKKNENKEKKITNKDEKIITKRKNKKKKKMSKLSLSLSDIHSLTSPIFLYITGRAFCQNYLVLLEEGK